VVSFSVFLLFPHDKMKTHDNRREEQEPCQVCGGKGEVIVSCIIKRDGSIKPVKVFKCPACGGKKVRKQSDNFL